MKINLNQKQRKLGWKSREDKRFAMYGAGCGKRWIFVVLIGMVVSFSGMAQSITKTFVKEIEVGAESTVVTNLPTTMDMYMHGTITMDNTPDGRLIYGKGDTPVLSQATKYVISTWDKNVIKQTVEISIIPEERAEAEAFLNALEMQILNNGNDNYNIDCNLNIWKMEMKNSFFSKDKTYFILNGGQKFNIKGLTIKSSLTIPKSNNLKIEGSFAGISVGDLDGELEANLKSCQISGGDIRSVTGTFLNCYSVQFGTVENVNFSAKNAEIGFKEVATMQIGFKSMKGVCELPFNKVANSSLNKYYFKKVGELTVAESANDNFEIDEIDNLAVPHAVFSNFRIGQLNKELYLQVSSGDLTLSKIAAGFESVMINNKTSTIILGTASDCSYTLDAYRNDVSEFLLPKSAKAIDKDKGMSSTYLKGDKATAGKITILCEQCKVVFMD